VNTPNDDRPPLATAAHWASQVSGLAFEVILPVLIGRWLDQRWGTSLWTFVGAVLGPVWGFWHLLLLTGVVGRPRKQTKDNEDQRP
jgi:hypothetical protein